MAQKSKQISLAANKQTINDRRPVTALENANQLTFESFLSVENP